MEHYEKTQNIDKMEELFQIALTEAGKPTIHIFTGLMNAYSECGKVSAMIELYKKMSRYNLRPDVTIYNIIIKTLARTKPEEAVGWFQQMERSGEKPQFITFYHIIKGFAKNLELEEADKWFKLMQQRRFQAPGTLYNFLISTSAKAKSEERISYYWKKMKEDNIKPDVVTYNTLLHYYQDKIEEIVRLTYEMRTYKIEPSLITYNIIIKAFAKHKKQAEVLEWFERMKSKVSPDIVTYVTMTDFLKEGGNVDQMLALYEEMKATVRPNFKIYNDIYQALKNTQSPKLEQWKALMLSKKYSPSDLLPNDQQQQHQQM